MKLAEALSIRADLQKQMGQLKSRMKESSKVQEGDEPAEKMEDLSRELDACLTQWEELVYRINETNLKTLHEGESITRLIARKDALTMRLNTMREVLKHASETDRYSRNEFRYIRYIDVATYRKEVDGYSQQLRELDLTLQSLNWNTELL